LLALLERKSGDAYILSKASSILTLFLNHFPVVQTDKVERTLAWFSKKLNDREADEALHQRIQSKVLENLKQILKSNDYRLAYTREGGLDPLFRISLFDAKQAVSGKRIEILYAALYCIWLLSFHPAVKKTMTRPELLSNLCLLLRVCQDKDKVVRMTLAILRNLLHIQNNNQLMISFGLDRLIQQIKTKPASMSDKDVVEDVEALEEALDQVKDELSSFDVYQSEVLGRNLGWSSPTHKSDKFWVENCLKIEDSNLLEILKDILEKEQRSEVLCVACWDIGEFVRFHPQGKSIVHNLDVKAPIIKLLTNNDTEVRSQALLTLQKVMITNWEYLQG
jgi:V-type H+-transporting ATPase subunit H